MQEMLLCGGNSEVVSYFDHGCSSRLLTQKVSYMEDLPDYTRAKATLEVHSSGLTKATSYFSF